MTEAQFLKKLVAKAGRQRKIQRTAGEKCERFRAKAERRCAAGVEGLAAKATRKSSRRKWHPLTYEQKYEKARVEVERRSAIKLVVEQKSEKARVEIVRRIAMKLTVEQKYEKARVDAERGVP